MDKDIHEIYWPVNDNAWRSCNKKRNISRNEASHRVRTQNAKYGANCDNNTVPCSRIEILYDLSR